MCIHTHIYIYIYLNEQGWLDSGKLTLETPSTKKIKLTLPYQFKFKMHFYFRMDHQPSGVSCFQRNDNIFEPAPYNYNLCNQPTRQLIMSSPAPLESGR